MFMDSIRDITADYPRFSDGRIDYTDKRVCFVLNCVVISGEHILLAKRDDDVIAYPNTLSGISGFIDRTDCDIETIARNELTEELRAPLDELQRIVVSKEFIQTDDAINREWHVFAVLVEFKHQFSPTINWENKTAAWYSLEDIGNMDVMPGFRETLDVALSLR